MMKESMIQVICGPGRGKTTSAIGRGLTALTKGKCVYMVQFLKGALDLDNMEIIQRLEPEFKIFRFEKTPVFFDRLTEEEKAEARICILNGLNFARKVLVTGECDVLILDEILGILDEGVISGEELCAIIAQARNAQIQLILTGTIYPDCLNGHVDEVTRIQTRYE